MLACIALASLNSQYMLQMDCLADLHRLFKQLMHSRTLPASWLSRMAAISMQGCQRSPEPHTVRTDAVHALIYQAFSLGNLLSKRRPAARCQEGRHAMLNLK